MPNYEYKCTQDGSTFELWQEVGAPAPPCPDCGAPAKKVFRPTRVIFKGSGFYVTDTRAESEKSAPAKTKSDDASAPEKTESATEAPATETKTAPAETPKAETPKAEA